MIQNVTVQPMNGILFLSDATGGETPLPERNEMDQLAWSTPTCMSFACRTEQHGLTEVVLGDRHEVDPGTAAKFSGLIETPSRAVAIVDVMDDIVLERRVSGRTTRVSIWFNHPRWPDKVTIGLE